MPKFRTRAKSYLIIGGMVLFFCLIAFQSAFAASASSTTIQGKITDQITNKPVPGASIVLMGLTGKTIATVAANGSGNYYIFSAGPSGVYMLKCSANGYISNSFPKYIQQGKLNTFNLSLKAQAVNTPPQIDSLTPANKSRLYTGKTISISVKATDKDKDTLQYRYTLDNKVMQDWTTSASYNFKMDSKQCGKHKIKVETRDNKGGIASKEAEAYVYLGFPNPGK